ESDPGRCRRRRVLQGHPSDPSTLVCRLSQPHGLTGARQPRARRSDAVRRPARRLRATLERFGGEMGISPRAENRRVADVAPDECQPLYQEVSEPAQTAGGVASRAWTGRLGVCGGTTIVRFYGV